MIHRLSERELGAHGARVITLTRAPISEHAPASDAAERELTTRLTRLLADERALAPARVCALLLRELARFRGDRRVTLHVHPHDLAFIPSAAELAATFELTELIELVTDAALERGGFILQSARGEVDARVETQVERAVALLLRGRA